MTGARLSDDVRRIPFRIEIQQSVASLQLASPKGERSSSSARIAPAPAARRTGATVGNLSAWSTGGAIVGTFLDAGLRNSIRTDSVGSCRDWSSTRSRRWRMRSSMAW